MLRYFILITSLAASILCSVCSDICSFSDTSWDVIFDVCNVLTNCSSSSREPFVSLRSLQVIWLKSTSYKVQVRVLEIVIRNQWKLKVFVSNITKNKHLLSLVLKIWHQKKIRQFWTNSELRTEVLLNCAVQSYWENINNYENQKCDICMSEQYK